MTDIDAGDHPDGWVMVQVERIADQLRDEAKPIRDEVTAAIARVLGAHGLDTELDGIELLEKIIWVVICQKVVARSLAEIGSPEKPETQSHVSSRSQCSSRSSDPFTWTYDERRHLLIVSGRDLQRDLAAMKRLVAEGRVPYLDAIIHQTGTTTMMLRGRPLDHWIATIKKRR
jgi:hypothetical protein